MATFSYIFSEEIFTTYDVRGVMKEDIKLEDAFYLGIAFGFFLKNRRTLIKKLFGVLIGEKPKVALGRDAREVTSDFEEEIIKGLITSGINVVETGEVPIPVIGYCVSHFDCEAGLAVGGSSVGENVIKFQFFLNDEKLTGEDIKNFCEILRRGVTYSSVSKGVVNEIEILETYTSEILETLKFNPNNKIKVGVDCLDGTAGNILKKMFKQLPFQMIIKNENCTGTACINQNLLLDENIHSLETFIEENNLDIAFSIDGDGKQILALTKEGKVLKGDELFFIVVKNYLTNAKNKKKHIVIDLASSIEIEKKIVEMGGIPVLASTGQSSVRELMLKSKANLGMEAKGHIYIKNGFYGYDDGIFAILKIISIISFEKRQLFELLNEIPFTFETKEIRIKTSYENEKFLEIKDLLYNKLKPERVLENEGIKFVIDKETASLMVRVCNTEDAISFKAEARNIETFAYLQNTLEEIKKQFF